VTLPKIENGDYDMEDDIDKMVTKWDEFMECIVEAISEDTHWTVGLSTKMVTWRSLRQIRLVIFVAYLVRMFLVGIGKKKTIKINKGVVTDYRNIVMMLNSKRKYVNM